MNLFDLFARITLETEGFEEGANRAKKLGESIGNGLKTAASIGVKAITAAAAGIAALTKASVENYAEYEQLVGGVETLFKDSADKVQEYAANAYKTAGMSANEYMSTVTSFSAALVNSLATTTEQATGAVTESTIKGLEQQLDELEKANDKKVDMLESSNEKEIEDFEKLTDEKIRLIDKQYTENLKLIDKEEYDRLQAIQNEIDAINAEQAADDKAAKQRAENERIASLEAKISAAETAEARAEAQEDLNEYLEKLEADRIKESRKARINELKEEKQAVKDESDQKRDVLKEQRDAEVKLVKDSAAEQLKEIKAAQKAELEALKESNKAKLDELKDYISEQKKLVTDGTVQVVNATAETYEKAAELADMAITDMSDNANKMGTDMEMLQNAYNGFAKQNYTMLKGYLAA